MIGWNNIHEPCVGGSGGARKKLLCFQWLVILSTNKKKLINKNHGLTQKKCQGTQTQIELISFNLKISIIMSQIYEAIDLLFII
jgi:hypothetical protein